MRLPTTSADRRRRREFRDRAASAEAPGVLAWVLLIVGALQILSLVHRGWGMGTIPRLTALLVIGLAWLMTRRDRVPAALVPWVMALSAAIVVAAIAADAGITGDVIPLVSVLIGMLVSAPFILSTPAMLAAAVPMSAAYVWALVLVAPPAVPSWLVEGAAALLLGGLILRVRLRGIDAEAALTRRLHDQATRDQLTGVLNRRGIEELAPALVAGAQRRGEEVFALFVDVDGLKAANDQVGHAFGDAVLVAVARVLGEVTRENDFVARWGGDEFLVVGTGSTSGAEDLEQRIAEAFCDRADLDAWSRTVSVGSAAQAGHTDLESLIRTADSDMYHRRATRRGGQDLRRPVTDA